MTQHSFASSLMRGIALLSAGLVAPCASDTKGIEVLRYRIVVETGMPHLEENLRYATTTSTQCLTRTALFVAFPVLKEASLVRCHLAPKRASDERAEYELVCPPSTGTTGAATWHLGRRTAAGLLKVKLGGKNMTFSQRITATAQGSCSEEADKS